MAHRQDDESASINKCDAETVLAEYTVSLANQPLSSRTREAYLAAVTAFLAWLSQRDGGPGDALVAPRARDLAARDYKRRMKVERGLSPASVNQALAGMDHLFRFLGLGAAIVRREELPRSAPRALDVEQQRLLMRAAEESTPRDRAIVALLLFTGLRLSEAAALQVADVRTSARKGLVVVRSGKGDAYREVELNALVRAMLDEWDAARKKIAVRGETSFFVSRTGTALSSRSIDLAVRRVAARARLELSAHVLRHTFVTGLVRAGNDLVLVAELAGHRRLETTRRYSLPSKADRQKAVSDLEIDF
ncbi:MAG: tyrosine-type recombinase/integrase [Actinomycetota bacterium]|nr:tyrosine-type recombinase/integrase [Actinomycetota bacterium]